MDVLLSLFSLSDGGRGIVLEAGQQHEVQKVDIFFFPRAHLGSCICSEVCQRGSEGLVPAEGSWNNNNGALNCCTTHVLPVFAFIVITMLSIRDEFLRTDRERFERSGEFQVRLNPIGIFHLSTLIYRKEENGHSTVFLPKEPRSRSANDWKRSLHLLVRSFGLVWTRDTLSSKVCR